MNLKRTAAAAIAASMMVAGGASAATLVTTDLTYQGGNDCAGYFGDNFEVCEIFVMDNGQRVELSPVIGKWDVDDQEWEISSGFPSFTGGEISIADDQASSSSWSYTPGVGDPGIRYWVAKGGANGTSVRGQFDFRLHWMVEDNVANAGACNVADPYTLACLSAALTVNGGQWSTATGSELSHLTLYDTDGPHVVIPLPAAGWLLLAGIGGLAAMRRRKKV